MTRTATTRPVASVSDRRIRALQVVFVVSGFCGLIYESIWSHYLKLFLGHAAYAQTVVLIVFIGGMALGAWAAGHLTIRIRNPLWAYAGAEVLIGLLSLLFHSVYVVSTDWAYRTLLPAACSQESACVVQWLFAALLILPQSVLLGTTFPLMTAGVLRVERTSPGRNIALFYFLNSLGAVGGVLASSFWLIPAVGLPGTLLTAGLMNVAVAIAAYRLGKGADRVAASLPADDHEPAQRCVVPLLVAALTGLSSFVYEIVWIRMLSLVIGSSTHSFELMLAAFILGLALGGAWIRNRIDHFTDLLRTLAIVQVLMGIAAVATLPLYVKTFDFLSWVLQALNRSDGGYLLYGLVSHGISLVIMLPATFLAGMTLPLITTALLRGSLRERAIGYVYAANTVGAILGVVIAVHFAMPLVGLKQTLLLGAAVDIAIGVVIFAVRGGNSRWRDLVVWGTAGVGALVAVGVISQLHPKQLASGVYRHGTASLAERDNVLYYADGKTASVAVVRVGESISIRTNGKSDAGIADLAKPASPDEYTMAIAAIVPLAYRPESRTAAIIGFGSGTTTSTLLASPRIERVDTIEIEPRMVEGAQHFGKAVARAFEDPRSHIVIDDAKSYFARGTHRYDLIVSEPSNPWVSGVASLFTMEFYDRILMQLAPGGIFVQWLQTYEFSDALLGSVLRAIDARFLDYTVFAANDGDLVIIASNEKLPNEFAADYLSWPDLAPVIERLDLRTKDELSVRRIAGKQTLRTLTRAMPVATNSDYFPVVEQLAPKARFIRAKASLLGELSMAPIPIIEMIEGNGGAGMPGDVSYAMPPLTKRTAVAAVRRSVHWLVYGVDPSAAVAPDVPFLKRAGELRAALWGCSVSEPGQALSEAIIDLATDVNIVLSTREATEVWNAIATAPCATQRLTALDRASLDLAVAVARRSPTEMIAQGNRVLQQPSEPSPLLRMYAAMAATAGHVLEGSAEQARVLMAEQLPKLPDNLRTNAAWQLLDGRMRELNAAQIALERPEPSRL